MQIVHEEKNTWSEETWQDIDWEEHKVGMKEYKGCMYHSAFNLIHGWLAIGNRNKIIEGKCDACPLCGEEDTIEHMFVCVKYDNLYIKRSLTKYLK